MKSRLERQLDILEKHFETLCNSINENRVKLRQTESGLAEMQGQIAANNDKRNPTNFASAVRFAAQFQAEINFLKEESARLQTEFVGVKQSLKEANEMLITVENSKQNSVTSAPTLFPMQAK